MPAVTRNGNSGKQQLDASATLPALDAMLLVSGKLANERVTVDDSSPEGTARIRVVFDKGKLVS